MTGLPGACAWALTSRFWSTVARSPGRPRTTPAVPASRTRCPVARCVRTTSRTTAATSKSTTSSWSAPSTRCARCPTSATAASRSCRAVSSSSSPPYDERVCRAARSPASALRRSWVSSSRRASCRRGAGVGRHQGRGEVVGPSMGGRGGLEQVPQRGVRRDRTQGRREEGCRRQPGAVERGGQQPHRLDAGHRGQQGSGLTGPALGGVAPEGDQRHRGPAADHRGVEGEVHQLAGVEEVRQQDAHRDQDGEAAGGEPAQRASNARGCRTRESSSPRERAASTRPRHTAVPTPRVSTGTRDVPGSSSRARARCHSGSETPPSTTSEAPM